MVAWGVRGDGDGVLDEFDGDVVAAHLMGDDTEEVKSLGLARLHCQDITVERLGLREPASLVVLDSDFKCLLDGHGLEWVMTVVGITVLQQIRSGSEKLSFTHPLTGVPEVGW